MFAVLVHLVLSLTAADAVCSTALRVTGHEVPAVVLEEAQTNAIEDMNDIAARLGLNSCPPTIDITMVATMDSAGELDPPFRVPAWAAGAAVPHERRIVVGLTSAKKLQNRHATLKHELAHVMVRQATGAAVLPRWFDEGAARLLAGEAGNADDLRALSHAKLADRILPLSSYNHGFPADANDAAVAYASAGRAVSLLVPTTDRWSALFDSLQQQSFENTVQVVSGRQVWQLSVDVQRSVSTWRSLLVVGFETDVLMGGCAVALVVGGVRSRRRFQDGMARLLAMDQQERAREQVLLSMPRVTRWTAKAPDLQRGDLFVLDQPS
jgi:hypothetical protein